MSDVVGEQELLDLVGDNGGVELLGERGHLVQVGGEVGRHEGGPGPGHQLGGEAGAGAQEPREPREARHRGLGHGAERVGDAGAETGHPGRGRGQLGVGRHCGKSKVNTLILSFEKEREKLSSLYSQCIISESVYSFVEKPKIDLLGAPE